MNTKMKGKSPGLTSAELDGRLNCFGEYDPSDDICSKACALCLNCAVAKNRFLGFQLLEDGAATAMMNFDSFEVE